MIRGHDITSKSISFVFSSKIWLIVPGTNAYAAVWSSLEANVSIICACLPPLHPLISRVFSFCFRPQPLHSSPASKRRSNTTYLTKTRKNSSFEHGVSAEHGPFFNEYLFDVPGGYSASISKVNTNEEVLENGDGIRVVRELKMVSDSRFSTPPATPFQSRDRDLEKNDVVGERRESDMDSRIERDLGDFEFPDYQERMNCPL